jgi:hypothetical protein
MVNGAGGFCDFSARVSGFFGLGFDFPARVSSSDLEKCDFPARVSGCCCGTWLATRDGHRQTQIGGGGGGDLRLEIGDLRFEI